MLGKKKKDNPLIEDAIKRCETELVRLTPGTSAYQELRNTIERHRHEQTMKRLDEIAKPHWSVNPSFWLSCVGVIASVIAAVYAYLAYSK